MLYRPHIPTSTNYPPCRPRSTKLFTSKGKYPETLSSYVEDFGPKPILQTACVRSGTASGNRNNNPHPSEVCGGGWGILSVTFLIRHVYNYPDIK